jgi:hypothetical protein
MQSSQSNNEYQSEYLSFRIVVDKHVGRRHRLITGVPRLSPLTSSLCLFLNFEPSKLSICNLQARGCFRSRGGVNTQAPNDHLYPRLAPSETGVELSWTKLLPSQ